MQGLFRPPLSSPSPACLSRWGHGLEGEVEAGGEGSAFRALAGVLDGDDIGDNFGVFCRAAATGPARR